MNSGLGLLDGNKDGVLGDDLLYGQQAADKFFRLYGDSDGDVDAQDFGQFGLRYRKTQPFE